MDTKANYIRHFSLIATLFMCLSFYSCQEDPTCFDGELNQDEIDIDCGGVCIDCEPVDCSIGLANEFSYSVDGVDMDVDSIFVYEAYENLVIEVVTIDPPGTLMIRHDDDSFVPGTYGFGGLSWMLYHTDENDFHSNNTSDSGELIFTEFSIDPDCPFVSGSFDVTPQEYQTGYQAHVIATFSELEYQ